MAVSGFRGGAMTGPCKHKQRGRMVLWLASEGSSAMASRRRDDENGRRRSLFGFAVGVLRAVVRRSR